LYQFSAITARNIAQTALPFQKDRYHYVSHHWRIFKKYNNSILETIAQSFSPNATE
jgi:hypothetical protein